MSGLVPSKVPTPDTNGPSPSGSNTIDQLDTIEARAIGRRREIEVVLAALSSGRNIVLEGPPGTGKSTLLRAIAELLGVAVVFVEGNAELTPSRLLGAHDPALVLERGYSADTYVDGPLVRAMRDGSMLYLEELNRIPEETLNVLITAMAEREVHIPRVGAVHADPAFRIVAAMNPFDSVGTARVSGAFADRANRVGMGYQTESDEQRIVEVEVADDRVDADLITRAVEITRATRSDREIRVGSSVRGAIDLVHIAAALSELRNLAMDHPDVTLDAALAALTGRIQLHEGLGSAPEPVVERLWRRTFAGATEPPAATPGKGLAPRPQGPEPAGT